RERSFARQQGNLLALHSAIWAIHPIHFHDHRRSKGTPGKIADLPLAGVIDVGKLPPAPRTLDLAIPPLAPYPQLQRFGLLIDLVLVNPITGPRQNLGELVVCRQTASLADLTKSAVSHEFLRRALKR